jgi:predicted nucleotidyltransferase
MTLTLEEIKLRLAASKKDLFARYPIRSIGIFGSFARGEAGPDSDVDILVEFSGPVGFEVADLAFELEDLLGLKVDLVPHGALRDRMRARVESDLVHV